MNNIIYTTQFDFWAETVSWFQGNLPSILDTLLLTLIAIVLLVFVYLLAKRLVRKATKKEEPQVLVPASKGKAYASESGEHLIVTSDSVWYVETSGRTERLIPVDGGNVPAKGKAVYFSREIKVVEVSLNGENADRIQALEEEYITLEFDKNTVKLGDVEFTAI